MAVNKILGNTFTLQQSLSSKIFWEPDLVTTPAYLFIIFLSTWNTVTFENYVKMRKSIVEMLVYLMAHEKSSFSIFWENSLFLKFVDWQDHSSVFVGQYFLFFVLWTIENNKVFVTHLSIDRFSFALCSNFVSW